MPRASEKTSPAGQPRKFASAPIGALVPRRFLATLMLLTLARGAVAQPAPAPSASLDRLRASIERITTSANATWGIYVKSLDTGEELAIDADRQMDTMSIIKIPLMVEVFSQVGAGKVALTDRYTLTKDDIVSGTGVIRMLEPGDTFTVKDLLTLMIVVSDNTATDVLYRLVGGPEAVNRRMQTLGLKQTVAPANARAWFDALSAEQDRVRFHREAKHPFGLSTPREIGRLLEQMERGTLVDKTSSDLMLQMMRGQIYRTRIPRFLTGFAMPHKTGDFLPYIANDVGVLESTGATVVVSIFTANHFGNGWALEEAIGHVAAEVAAYFGYRR